VLLAAAVLLLRSADADATRPTPGIPDPFYGVVLQHETLSDLDVTRLQRGQVGTVRFALPWARVERKAGTYDWSPIDRKLEAIRSAGAEPLPFVFGMPARFGTPWHSPLSTPDSAEAWTRFLHDLVARYGPGGELATIDPGFEPIRTWQIWNEPNLPGFWGPGAPDPAAYVELLRASVPAIHAVNPAAGIVAAGLAPARKGIHASDYMAGIYRAYEALGVPPDFDQASVHPYATTIRESIERIVAFRDVVDAGAAGIATPILVGEVGWGSGTAAHPFLNGTEASQARHVTRLYRKLGERRRELGLSGVLWFAWQDRPAESPGCGFCTIVGLFDADGGAKRAWKSFKQMPR
jgi:hypothetical protein